MKVLRPRSLSLLALTLVVLVNCVGMICTAQEIQTKYLGDVDHLAFRIVERRENTKLKLLLREGLSPRLKASDGTTLLMYAAMHGDAEGVRILLDAGADPNAANEHGGTALIYGAVDLGKVQALVEHGADVNAKSSSGMTPLLSAASWADGAESLAYLIQSGAKLESDNRGRIPLGYACFSGSLENVNALLRSDRSIHFESGHISPIAFASRHDPELLSVLWEWIESKHPQAINDFANDALYQSLQGSNRENVQFLINRGVKADPRNVLNAAYSDVEVDPFVYEYLLNHGASLDAEADWHRNYNAVDFAILRGHVKTEELLRSQGAAPSGKLKSKHVPECDIELTPENNESLVSNAVNKSLKLLLNSSDRFLHNGEQCSSCHHQHLPAIATSIARARGLEPSHESLERMNRRNLDERVRKIPGLYERGGVATQGNGYRLWMWSAQGLPANSMTKAMSWWMANVQCKDGHWQAQNIRTPLEDGDHQATALGVRALVMFPLVGREVEYAERIERAAHWLAQNPVEVHTQQAFRLLGLSWAGANSEILTAVLDEIMQTQKPDGGWSQLPNMESDAWATGLALLAAHSAGLETSDPAYQHGMEFLLRTQFEDGSWWVRSRSVPVVLPHFDSDFPHGWDQWISAAGTAVAAASLALSLEPVETEWAGADFLIESEPSKKKDEKFVYEGDRTIDFEKQIRPLLSESCADCHTGNRPRGNFDMTDRESFIRGGQSGWPTVFPGKGAESQIILHVTDQVEDMEMPPLAERGSYPKLSPEQVQTLTTWIDEGAVWPDEISLDN